MYVTLIHLLDTTHTQDGIIAKLKQYDAYIDNELPDYIIVMLANKKSMLQVKNDLQLFLGSNTDAFTDWLQKAMSVPDFLDETTREMKSHSVDEKLPNNCALLQMISIVTVEP